MAAISPIVINDGATVPVAKTFSPTTASLDLAKWQDRTGGIFTGMPSIILSSRKPNKDSKLFKVRATIEIPTMEVVSNNTVSGIAPAPSVAYATKFSCEFMLPERCSLQNRKDLVALAGNLILNAQLKTLVENFESPY